MAIKDFVTLVSNSCFPVVVSAYLLIRLEKQIEKLNSSINLLSKIVSAKLGLAVDTDHILNSSDKNSNDAA